MIETRTPSSSRRAAIKRLAVGAAAAAMPLLATRAQAHTEKPHTAKTGPVVKEQKDWGIAGDAKRAKRNIAVGMATYEVQIRERGRLAATRQITFQGPVLADVEIGPDTGTGGGGGGR